MPDDKLVPMGVPGNPLWRVPMDAMLPYQYGYRPPQFMPVEKFGKPRLENPGVTNASGVALNQGPNIPAYSPTALPESIYTPDPVSAMDPAFSMHPIVKALSSKGGISGPNYYPSVWTQMPLSRRNISRSDLITALGLPGLGGQTQTQGVDQ